MASPAPELEGNVSAESVVSWRSTLLVAAAASVAFAMQRANGAFDGRALLAVTVALVALVASVVLRETPGPARSPWPERVALVLAALAFIFQFVMLLIQPAAMYARLRQGMDPAQFTGSVVAGAALVGLTVARPTWLRLLAVGGLVLAHFCAASFILKASPNPFIDVFTFQHESVTTLLAGHNPYGIDFPNIYGHSTFYGEGVVEGSRLHIGFPYPPLSLLLIVPGQVLAGDLRCSQLVAMELAALLLAWVGRRGLGPVAAALYLFTPRTFFVLEQSWTEPFVVFLFVLFLAFASSGPWVRGVLAGLLFAVKQHLVLLLLVAKALPESWTRGRAWVRPLLVAIGVAAALTLPFMLGAFDGFWRGVVLFQFRQPFRADALSYPAGLVRAGGPQLGSWLGFAMLIPVAVLAWFRAPRSLGGFAACAALLYLTFFAFNKQAFCNYYELVLGLVCCALAAQSSREPAGAAVESVVLVAWVG